MEVVGILADWTIFLIYLLNLYLLILETHSKSRTCKEKEVVGRRNVATGNHCRAPSIHQRHSTPDVRLIYDHICISQNPSETPVKISLSLVTVQPSLPVRTVLFTILKHAGYIWGKKHMAINVRRVCILCYSVTWHMISEHCSRQKE